MNFEDVISIRTLLYPEDEYCKELETPILFTIDSMTSLYVPTQITLWYLLYFYKLFTS